MKGALNEPSGLTAESPGKGRRRDEHARGTGLRGARLLLARAAWLAIAGFTVLLYLLSISISIQRPATVCTAPPCDPSQPTPADVQKLQQLGLSLGFLNVYYTATEALFVLVCVSGAAAQNTAHMIANCWNA